ncbi:hypothetical protein LIER_27626 [Lithospermum erythrorhizon]|uniref:Uncharacterized protein n=1 Tax=Lithospermum erythrorhizon TaxID=34254 RepID=A0AAV3RGU1_LITER
MWAPDIYEGSPTPVTAFRFWQLLGNFPFLPMLRNQARNRLSKCCPNEMADSLVEHSFLTAAACLRLKASSETSILPPYLVRASKAMFGVINSATIDFTPSRREERHEWNSLACSSS